MFIVTDFETMARNTCKFHNVPITSAETVQELQILC